MTLDFFVKNYNLSDFDVKKIYVENNKLYIIADYNVYLELIANGYRPEMNMDVEKTFIFNTVDANNHKFKAPFKLNIIEFDKILTININDIILKIHGDVEIK